MNALLEQLPTLIGVVVGAFGTTYSRRYPSGHDGSANCKFGGMRSVLISTEATRVRLRMCNLSQIERPPLGVFQPRERPSAWTKVCRLLQQPK
jgi:hypothetical protein